MSDSLIQFPAPFTIKAMGRYEEGFELLVFEILQKHVPGLVRGAMRRKRSRGGTYMAVSITFQAESMEQLDEIYRELSRHGKVLMVL